MTAAKIRCRADAEEENHPTTKDQVVALLAPAEANGGKFSVLISRFGRKPVGAAAATGLLLR